MHASTYFMLWLDGTQTFPSLLSQEKAICSESPHSLDTAWLQTAAPVSHLAALRTAKDLCSHLPWMLSICPSFSAAPRTLHKVLTILSALASDRNGLESITAFFPEGKKREWTLILASSLHCVSSHSTDLPFPREIKLGLQWVPSLQPRGVDWSCPCALRQLWHRWLEGQEQQVKNVCAALQTVWDPG